MTGWLTCAGWQAEITTAAFFTGTLIQGMLVENHAGYGFQRWHGTLLTWAAILLAVAFNTILSPALPKVEGMVLVLHILGFVAILVPLVYLAPHSTPSEVFTVPFSTVVVGVRRGCRFLSVFLEMQQRSLVGFRS